MRLQIACVGEDTPRYHRRVLTLFATAREFGGRAAEAQFVASFVDSLDLEVKAMLRQLGVETRVVERFDPLVPTANKVRALEADGDYDLLLLLDCDVAFAGDPVDFLDADHFQARPVLNPSFTPQQWESLLEHFGVSRPTLSGSAMPNFNNGVIAIPAEMVGPLLDPWSRVIRGLPRAYAGLDGFGLERPFSDQDALTIALAAIDAPTRALPLEMNFPAGGPIAHRLPGSGDRSPVLIHYHAEAEVGGPLLGTGLTGPDRQIERVNALVANWLSTFGQSAKPDPQAAGAIGPPAFDNRAFWDWRYSEDPELGSGTGSRGRALEHKREVVHRLVTEHQVRSVLDVGCGDLAVSSVFQGTGVEYTGIDVSRVIVERNRAQYPGWTFIDGDFLEVAAARDLQADLVICFDMLIHESDRARYQRAVAELVRASTFIGVVSGFERPPRIYPENAAKPSSFFHEPITVTLNRFARDVGIVGSYARVHEVLFLKTR